MLGGQETGFGDSGHITVSKCTEEARFESKSSNSSSFFISWRISPSPVAEQATVS